MSVSELAGRAVGVGKEPVLYIYLLVLGVCLVCDWLAFRDWRGGPFLGVGGSNATTVSFGRAADVPSTAVLPVATYAMTAMMLSGVVSELAGSVHGALLHFLMAVQPVVDSAVVVLLALTTCVFLFMLPRFLVPPPFRGRPGYVAALWKRLRR